MQPRGHKLMGIPGVLHVSADADYTVDPQIPEPSISASWDEDTKLYETPQAQGRAQLGSACTARSTSSRHSQLWDTRQNNKSSGISKTGARDTSPDLQPVTGRALSARDAEEETGGEKCRTRTATHYSFSAGSPHAVLSAKICEDEESKECTTPGTLSCSPRVAQVTVTDLELPEITEENPGKRRRQHAALINKLGPLPETATIRPVSADPTPCELNDNMMLHACGVDDPSDVEDLALNNHGIASIAIGKLPAFTALKALNLENNLVSDITPLGRLESLVQLHVACNRIKSLPKLSDGLFFQLRVLDVGFNQIPVTEVFARESDWSRLPSLRRLDMSGNHLSSLPEAIGSFPSLQQLTLEYNQLSGESLRPLGSLRKLEILGLANNHVDSIPAEAFKACSFNNLTVLDLSRNWIRKPETLKVLQQVRNGTTVYIGDNPLARKMRLQLLQPKSIPGSRPGTVGISEDAREPATTTVLAEGACPAIHSSTEGIQNSSVQVNTGGGPTVDPLSNASTSSVFVKMMRYAPKKPMLAKSLLDGILHVRKSTSRDQHGVLKLDEGAGERLLAVFDELNVDIDKWREMQTVPEESESGLASCAGESTADRQQQSIRHSTEADDQPLEPEAEALGQQSCGEESAFPDQSDPTERISARLGLDYKLLSHYTGLLGTDVNGAVSRLRFMLLHSSSSHLGAMKAPKHLMLTKAAALKQRPKKHPDKPVISLPTPPSKHEQQVETIHTALLGMQTKLARVQKDLVEQLERYEFLIDDKTDRSVLSTPLQGMSRPDTVTLDQEGSQKQGLGAPDPGQESNTGLSCVQSQGIIQDAVKFPESDLGAASESELSTYFQKQEQGHQAGMMQAAAEADALGYK